MRDADPRRQPCRTDRYLLPAAVERITGGRFDSQIEKQRVPVG
ncbi:hypothetical protein [Streptomyces sp. NPDC088746]